MRHLEVGFVDRIVTKHNQVEIERSRGAWIRPFPAERLLDSHDFLQQRACRERRLAHHHGIQKKGLPLESFPLGFGFDDL